MVTPSLCVIHLSKKEDSFSRIFLETDRFAPGAFRIETCQRALWIYFGSRPPFIQETQIFQGQEAYEFLLRFSAGLESAVLGETDVFGQVKQAWNQFKETRPTKANPFQRLIQNLYEDTKEIRSHYLRGVGGQSYGSLVRALLHPTPDDSILLVGAGLLAQSVAPYLLDGELFLVNRNPERLGTLEQTIRNKFEKAPRRCENLQEALALLPQMKHVVVCTPEGSEADSSLIAAWRELSTKTGKFLHLGMRKNPGILENFLTLEDLFSVETLASQSRRIKVKNAKKACSERAKLRYMGESITLAHGWEDLAIFAL